MIIGRGVFNSWNDMLDPPRDPRRLVWRDRGGNATSTNDFREKWMKKRGNDGTTAITKTDLKRGRDIYIARYILGYWTGKMDRLICRKIGYVPTARAVVKNLLKMCIIGVPLCVARTLLNYSCSATLRQYLMRILGLAYANLCTNYRHGQQ